VIFKDKNSEEFKLKNQGAQNFGRYDFLKDISRLEKFKNSEIVKKMKKSFYGYAIFLTNDYLYWKKTNRKKIPSDIQFRLQDSNEIEKGEHGWENNSSSGIKKGRTEKITLSNKYEISWSDYSKIDKSKNCKNSNHSIFRYLLVKIK